jgi:hypothetical protein
MDMCAVCGAGPFVSVFSAKEMNEFLMISLEVVVGAWSPPRHEFSLLPHWNVHGGTSGPKFFFFFLLSKTPYRRQNAKLRCHIKTPEPDCG